MLIKNIPNLDKKNKIIGNVFHVFYIKNIEASVFDSNMDIPLIYGEKNIIYKYLKSLDIVLPKFIKQVVIHYYVPSKYGHRLFFKYEGDINTVKTPLI